MAWYDTFASFYDHSLEQLYRDLRVEVVDGLAPEASDRVLVLPAGTGQDFEPLITKMGPAARICGIDRSSGMLAKAQRRIDEKAWASVTVLEGDATDLDTQAITQALGGPPDLALCALGLTVFPEPEKVLDDLLAMLPRGGRIALFDVFAHRWVPQTTMVQWMARADLRRRPWEWLQARCEAVVHRELEGSPHVLGGTPWMAVGVKD